MLRVPFAIDACDREVIAWQATTAGVSGEMVRDLVVGCVERRFGATRAAHPVEWLSDNGAGYRAKDTLDTATALGLRLAFTPVRSPESNGVAEAFVKTLKRDTPGSRCSRMPRPSSGSCPPGSRTTTPATRTPACGCSHPESSGPGVPNTNQPPVRSNGVHSTLIERSRLSVTHQIKGHALSRGVSRRDT